MRSSGKKDGESYAFTAYDLACYIKWSGLYAEQEYAFLKAMWGDHRRRLSKSAGRTFDAFKERVYQQLYFLWERGFYDEESSLAAALDPVNHPPVFFPVSQGQLEIYLKLLALHLTVTPRLPSLPLDWATALPSCGIKRVSARLFANTARTLAALNLRLETGGGEAYTVDNFRERERAAVVTAAEK